MWIISLKKTVIPCGLWKKKPITARFLRVFHIFTAPVIDKGCGLGDNPVVLPRKTLRGEIDFKKDAISIQDNCC